METIIRKMKEEKTLARLRIQTVALKAIHDHMEAHGVTQLMPVMLSPITDPLCHSVHDAGITYEGQALQLTKSMLLHKQAAMLVEGLERLYIVSPNVRLERKECRESGRHLIEFSQVDIELKGATKREFMAFMEGLVVAVLTAVQRRCGDELARFGRQFAIPRTPFAVFESKALQEEHGDDYERILSRSMREPFWILDLKREFYDKEDAQRRGYYHNYDLVWPEGFGEALSGGERDYEHGVLLRKLEERGQREDDFAPYMALAKRGLLVPTAGGGLGVERLVRFLTGDEHIGQVALFPRVPGEKLLL